MFLAITLAFPAMAQKAVVTSTDSIQTSEKQKFIVFASASYSGQELKETYASFANLGIGLVFDRTFEVLLFYGVILDQYKSQVIFPNSFSLEQANWGTKLQYSFTKRAIRPIVGLDGILAQLSWKSQGDFEEEYSDRIYMVNPFIGGAWNAFGSVIIQATAGYNFTYDLELVGFNSADYNGLRLELALKIGLFGIN